MRGLRFRTNEESAQGIVNGDGGRHAADRQSSAQKYEMVLYMQPAIEFACPTRSGNPAAGISEAETLDVRKNDSNKRIIYSALQCS